MAKSLIIVESPAKIKTLKKLLGSDYEFSASYGHIRDLPKKNIGIDFENNFEPTYEVLEDKQKVVKELLSAVKKCEMVYLSPDPDREGEAIAWHIHQLLPKGTKTARVAFNSLTKPAIKQALDNPRDINEDLVDAQQARRLLDRIVGYKISPLLNQKIFRGPKKALSAGRVQSVALKLVVDREKEIQAFVKIEYWTLTAQVHKEPSDPFSAYLFKVNGETVVKEKEEGKKGFLISNEQTALELKEAIEKQTFILENAQKKDKQRHPLPPFITSTLQQEASRHFGFSPARTMSIAQGLYEGIDIGSDSREGLITYMRTDSTRVAQEAINDARQFINSTIDSKYLPEKPRFYKSKKSAQDAHEAIRPTNILFTPEKARSYLTDEQYKLYSLIWKRMIASQMASAIYETVTYDISASKDYLFRASGSILKFKGFLHIYEEKEDKDSASKNDNPILPNISEGSKLNLEHLDMTQSFTRPPARYTEASLVKALESCGIGRPSTYAAIMSKIQNRDYTSKEKGRLVPTDLGFLVTDMLEKNFETIMSIDFTANLEDSLEAVAEGNSNWTALIKTFWSDFNPYLDKAKEDKSIPKIETTIECPECSKGKLQKIWYRNKMFYGCSEYPECKYSSPVEKFHFSKKDYNPDFNWEQPCPLCKSAMEVRHGPYGTFLGCSKYPECKGTVPIPKKNESLDDDYEAPECPAIGCDGKILKRRSRFGKIFFSCSSYPDCNVIVNDIDDLETKYIDHPKTPYVSKKKKAAKKTTKKKATAKKTTKTKSSKPSNQPKIKLPPELAELCKEKELSRPQIIKKIWEHIKANDLQDPSNKQYILLDNQMKKVFKGEERVHMFTMNKHLSEYLKENHSD